MSAKSPPGEPHVRFAREVLVFSTRVDNVSAGHDHLNRTLDADKIGRQVAKTFCNTGEDSLWARVAVVVTHINDDVESQAAVSNLRTLGDTRVIDRGILLEAVRRRTVGK
jgi:hypothetical protein